MKEVYKRRAAIIDIGTADDDDDDDDSLQLII
jgi:hypothetical protein